ncbi:uncharacterized protein LOC122378278 isoform X2 [Amphibalanus amphitrite]|uniref:uncharacterized protein LOC122378278 isoform X2 n=1 Tax=Amphibalanus amphitrite TaxID=1232801 RepID=UPI001C929F28|nr:uncharacterized protein LOC122378278 isoform X2 [Amphibalanus amphitrite]
MVCSAITLSLATVAGVISVALLGIAFGTDNWMYIRVDRKQIQEDIASGAGSLSEADQERFESSGLFRSRTQGLFRTCYPETKPKGVELYLSPVETYCENIDYYIPDEENLTKSFSEERMARLHMARSMIALFIAAFFFVFVAFWTGVTGCWRRSPGNIGTTAALMLFACLFSAGSMGLWHGVQYYEQKKLNEAPFYQSWPPLLQERSVAVFDWSYFIAWVGVGWVLVSALLFVGASVCLKREMYSEKRRNLPYIMPVYPTKSSNGGYGPNPGYAYAASYSQPGPYYSGQQYAYNY